MNQAIETYLSYMNHIGNRYKVYKAVAEAFPIHSALYPGSHVDITPSLLIPQLTYVDNYKGTKKFFAAMDSIKTYIEQHKDYAEPCEVTFLPQDYTEVLVIEPVDLIISQYAGLVGQATKPYLKSGGLLLCNDSHGDATMAHADPDFEFIGVLACDSDRCSIQADNLDSYFELPKGKSVDLDVVHSTMKGPNYKLKTENYLFMRK